MVLSADVLIAVFRTAPTCIEKRANIHPVESLNTAAFGMSWAGSFSLTWPIIPARCAQK